MRFLIDENLPFSLTTLLENSHDVFDIATSPLRGVPDHQIWAFAAQERRILVSRDLDFPLLATPPNPPGLILIRVPEIYTAEQITQLFASAWVDIEPSLLERPIVVISPGRVRIRPWI